MRAPPGRPRRNPTELKLTDTFPSIKRLKLDMKSEWSPAVKQTLGHASMLLSLAVHWELIGVTTP